MWGGLGLMGLEAEKIRGARHTPNISGYHRLGKAVAFPLKPRKPSTCDKLQVEFGSGLLGQLTLFGLLPIQS